MYSHKCLVTKYKYILMMEKLIENNYYSINNNIYDCTPSRKNRSKRCEKEKPYLCIQTGTHANKNWKIIVTIGLRCHKGGGV